MPRLIGIALLATVVAAAPPCQARLAAQDWEGLEVQVRDLMATHTVPGLALAVVRDGRVDLVRGFGHASVPDELAVEAENTVFRTGSVAKLFVATIVADLARQGVLDLHRDIREYVPEIPIDEAFEGPITLHHLLTHTAGFDERLIGYAARSREAMVPLGDYLTDNLPRRGWPPGRLVGYSNHGMSLAAYIVERVTGLPFHQYAKENLFDRLEMNHTSYIDPVTSSRTVQAMGHDCGDAVETCVEAPVLYSHAYPVGLAFTTAGDMARFLLAQLGPGESEGPSEISSQTLSLMQTEQFTHADRLPGMSYGFFNQRTFGRHFLAHSGSAGGFYALLMLAPEERVGFFFVINGGRSDFAEDLRDLLLSRLLPDAGERAVAPEADASPIYPMSPDELARFSGPYQLTRYAHHTIESLPLLFGMSIVAGVTEDNHLWLPYDGGMEFAPVDRLRFRHVDGDEEIVFTEDDRGRITHMFAGVPTFGAMLPGALERRAWYDATLFKNEYLSFLVAVPLIILFVAWPLASITAAWRQRRRAGAIAVQSRLPRFALIVALLFVALLPVMMFGVLAASLRELATSSGIIYGMTSQMRLLLIVPWALALLSGPVLVFAIKAWRNSYWGPLRRVYYSVIATSCLLTVAMLLRWNYLPPVW